jgi:hypothetical protein
VTRRPAIACCWIGEIAEHTSPNGASQWSCSRFAVMEPEEGDAHNVFVDGTVMSPGSEDYNLSPASELVDQFRRSLDSEVQLSEGA